MASLTLVRSTETMIRYSASGLTSSHTYVIQFYGNGSWWDKTEEFYGTTSMSGWISVDTGNSYSARLWDKTISGTVATATVEEWSESRTTIYVRCGEGVSQFTVVTDIVRRTVTSSSYVSCEVTEGESVTISGVVAESGYTTPLIIRYNTSSSGSTLSRSYEFTGSTTISSTTYTRYIEISASTQEYQYKVYVYVDGTLTESYGTLSTTSTKVRVSDTQAYQDYYSTYDFDYARAGSSTVDYAYYSQIPLDADSVTVIRLYFKTKKKSVQPIISSISTTNTTATIYWNKNGGSYGSWYLYYGTSTSSMQSAGTISSSPKTLTGLKAGTAYVFYIQNTVSSSDSARSDYASATTKDDIGYFAWTNNDSSNIVAGQPVTNITASAWNNLISKISACGGSSSSVYSASSGSKITANHFNSMRNAISGLCGAGSVPSSVTAGASTVLASLFISLKEAINRAISYKNST